MKVKNEKEALNILKNIQQTINDQVTAYHNFRFEISINEKSDEVEIKGRDGYIMRGYKKINEPFKGKTLVDAMNEFLSFFETGGKLNIEKDVEGFQFYADISYMNGWIVNIVHLGRYYHTGW